MINVSRMPLRLSQRGTGENLPSSQAQGLSTSSTGTKWCSSEMPVIH